MRYIKTYNEGILDIFKKKKEQEMEVYKDPKNTIDFNTLDFKSRIKIIEQLPTNIINKVIKFIENYRSKVKELTTVNVLGIDKDISLDASFFNT